MRRAEPLRARPFMPLGRRLLLTLAAAALAATPAAWAAETFQSPAGQRVVYVTAGAGEACAAVGDGAPECFALPPGVELREIQATADGWLVAGTLALPPGEELFLLERRDDLVEPLPLPPRGSAARRRGQPTFFVDHGRLEGAAWLEGDEQADLTVWAAAWDGRSWGRPELVGGAGPGSQLAPAATVLADGRWLLLWTAWDGRDDDIVYSLFDGRRWSAPRRLHAANEVPDVLPSVVAAGDGALAAWSRFDGTDYRPVTAWLRDGAWRESPLLPGRGGLRTGFTSLAGGVQLLHRTVSPAGWTLVELAADGRPLDRLEVATDRRDRPLVVETDDGLGLAWPPAPGGEETAAPPAAAASGAAAEVAGSDTFRYMAFGDSITAGLPQHDECGLGGYPGRLPGLLGCALPNCQIVNEGLGGEDTADAVSRMHDLLEDEGPWDIVLLMEGTNDICFRGFSNNTIEFNLGQMDADAAAHGVDTLHASIIHFHPNNPTHGDNLDGQVANMRMRVRDNLAHVDADTGHRWWADPWTPLCPSMTCFNQHYTPSPPDPVGHPDCSGYDILADVFLDGITAKPAPLPSAAVEPSGTTSDASPTFRWNKEQPRNATWYQFQLEGPGGTLHDAWYAEEEICAPWQCTLDLGTFPEGSYVWRVRGRNARGRSAWIETSFEIDLLSPPGGATPLEPDGPVDERPAFVWSREVPTTATSYRLEVRDGSGVVFSQSFAALLVCGAQTCTVEPFATGDPLAAGPHAWRVRGSNAAGDGPWSPLLAFEVVPGLIFMDGFESGNLFAWSLIQP